MAQLVSLAKYKEAIGDASSTNDGKYTEAIEDASAAILTYTDRDFAAPDVTETRAYTYDGSGILEIDDCHTITNVTYNGASLASSVWKARKEGPAAIPVFSYLELPPHSLQSAEMGFERNEDVYLLRHGYRDVDVGVTATFGWPVVPDDVQRAAIWTAAAMISETSGAAAGLAAKSVAEVAENYIQAGTIANDPIPRRALALLEAYRRHLIA